MLIDMRIHFCLARAELFEGLNRPVAGAWFDRAARAAMELLTPLDLTLMRAAGAPEELL
jgi:hypothetical protein